jgi:hypothetical protein
MLGNSAACGKPILAGKRIDPRAAGPNVAGMDHSPGFLKVVNEARTRVKEITLDQARVRLAANPRAVLLDVREDAEWAAGHAAGAVFRAA